VVRHDARNIGYTFLAGMVSRGVLQAITVLKLAVFSTPSKIRSSIIRQPVHVKGQYGSISPFEGGKEEALGCVSREKWRKKANSAFFAVLARHVH
jgi:hypothetical protein